MLAPLGDRVLIKPDVQPSFTASGLEIIQDKQPEQRGTVVAVGRARHPLKDVAFDLADKLEKQAWAANGSPYLSLDAAKLLRDCTGREPEVKIGDDVIFSWQVGQELWVNHGQERYLLMREADILAVVEG